MFSIERIYKGIEDGFIDIICAIFVKTGTYWFQVSKS